MDQYYDKTKTKFAKLLFDETTVYATSGCKLHFNQVAKESKNPAIAAVRPWEGRGPYTGAGSRLQWIPEKQIYRFGYGTFNGIPYAYGSGYVESSDGLNWERPALLGKKIEDFEYYNVYDKTGRARLCLPSFQSGGVYDPRPNIPQNERFKKIGHSALECAVFYSHSPDGVSDWVREPDPIWHACSDILATFWDPNIQKFVCYYKLWKIYAQEKDDSPDGSHPITILCTTWEERKLDDGWTEIYGNHFVDLHPESKAEVGPGSFIVRDGEYSSDDGGGGHLMGAWYSKRVLHRAVSDDFIHWEHEQEILNVDELDRPDSNFQGMNVFLMGGYYLGIVEQHDQRGHFDLKLVTSSDGIHWKRPWRGSLIPHGAPGEFDHGMVTCPVQPVVTSTQLIFYYGAMSDGHDALQPDNIGIGRAVLRRDGFACWENIDDTSAILETIPFTRSEDFLGVNVSAEGGWLTAALLDETGNQIPGYTHEQCNRIIEDSSSYTDCIIPVTWRGSKQLPGMVGDKFRVQLRFQHASVYSIRI